MELLLFTLLLQSAMQIHCLGKEPSDISEPLAPLPLKSAEPGPPVITEQPVSQLVEGSATARLNCRVSGNPKPTIKWLKDGSPLESATVNGVVQMPYGDLHFLRVLDKGEGATTGVYQCIATNRYGSVVSQNASIELTSIDDDFRKQPSDVIAAVGQSVTIECQGPRGIPEPEISWMKNNKKLSFDGRIEVRPGGNLVISDLRKSDTASYTCVASNVAGERTSTAAMLRVRELPRITFQPSNTHIEVGESAQLRCDATGDPKPRIRWTRKNGRIPKKFNQANGILRMNKVGIEDEGQYTCSATNLVGKDTATVNVTVQTISLSADDDPLSKDRNVRPGCSFLITVKAKIVRTSDDMTSQLGGRSTLTCRVEGKPQPTIFWKDPNGVELFVEDSQYNGRIYVATNGDLIINNVKFEDQGVYTCQASNVLQTVSADIRLTVLKKVSKTPPPVIILPPSNSTASLRSTTYLDCLSQNATTQWYKDGKQVLTGSGRLQLLSTGSLKIFTVQNSDEGRYTCKVSNEHGIDECEAWLHVGSAHGSQQPNQKQYVPQSPGQPRLIKSTSECLTIEWKKSINEDFPILYYIIAYFRIGSSSSRWQKVSPIAENSHQFCSLEASSEYVFVVRGVNGKGVGRASATSDVFATKSESVATPSNALKNLDSIAVDITATTSLGSHSMRIHWTTNGSCSNLDGFMVISQPVSATSSDIITGQAPCSARTYDLVDFSAHTKYEVRVRPLKDQRAGFASPVKFLTLEAGLIPAASPTITVEKNSQNNRVTVLWQPPQDLPTNHVIGYVIRLKSLDSGAEQNVKVNSTVTKIVIQDLLTEAATYDVTVTYKTRMGEGMTSEAKNVTIDSPGGIFDQPIIIAAIAAGALVLVGVLAISIYCCKKSRRKTTGYQASTRSKSTRYNPVTYQDNFEIKPSIGVPQRGAGADPDILRDGQQRNPNLSDIEYLQLMQNPGNKSNMMTYSLNSGEVRNQLIEGPTIDGAKNTVPAKSFSYVPGQQYNTTGVSKTTQQLNMSNMTSQQAIGLQHQALTRQRSAGSAYSGSNPSEADARRQYAYPESAYRSPLELPPPPTPPVSPPNSSISQRSRASSGKHSTGDRSSRSGHRSRRSVRNNRIPPVHAAAYNLPEEAEIGYSSQYGTPLLSRASADERDPSSIPPTPPVRGDSNSRTVGHARLQYDPKLYNTTPHMAGIAAMHYDSEGETDQLGLLQVRRPFPNYDYRNSANVSNLSMLNGYGSESDARESLHDRHSIISTSSDVESFHMESVSQVGQNYDKGNSQHSGAEVSGKKSFPTSGDNFSKQNYSSTYHHYPVECYGSEAPVNPGNVFVSSRKITNKARRNDPIDHGDNSASSCASSYHQNTGDSGMSAGVGCSTEHSSSLNSHASAGSAALNITNRGALPPSIGKMSLPREGANAFNLQEDVGFSPTCGMNKSAPSSAAPSRYQSPAKAIHASATRSSGKRLNHNLPDSRWYPNADTNNSNRIPLSPIQSPGQEQGYLESEDANREFQTSMLIKPSEVYPSQQLSDVPEVSTSDFCEDFSDQSQ